MKKDKSVNRPPVMVILHGWVASDQTQTNWQPVRDALAASGLETVFLPLPGLDTDLPAAWTLTNYVQWLGGELSQIQSRYPGQPIVLLGHSFGGQIALAFCAGHPGAVSKLILIASAGMVDRRWQKVLKRSVFSTLARLAAPLKFLPGTRWLLYKLLGEHDYLEASPTQRQTMTSVITQEVVAEAAQLALPTLIIWGEEDTITPLYMGEKFTAIIPGAQLVSIPGARHSPQYTHVSQVAEMVLEFVGSDTSTSTRELV